jgi:hypothetical protein
MQAVYTALIGAYEELNEQPQAADSSMPFICFTDDPSLRSDSWQIELVEPALLADPIRSARRLKILGHPAVERFDETLWIDNSVVLSVPPEALLADWLSGADLAIPLHSFRERLIDEFDAVVSAGLDDAARVYEQLQHYLEAVPEVLHQRPLWNAMVARRRTATVAEFGEIWYQHVLRYSRRDQLSVLVALRSLPGLGLRAVDIDNHSSPVHCWPVTKGRKRSGPLRDPVEAAKPLAARLRALERSLQELELDRTERTAQLAELRADSEARISVLEAEAQALRGRAHDLGAQLDDILSSRTWRVGRVAARVVQPILHPFRRHRRDR